MPSPPSQTYLDQFNRADEQPLTGSWASPIVSGNSSGLVTGNKCGGGSSTTWSSYRTDVNLAAVDFVVAISGLLAVSTETANIWARVSNPNSGTYNAIRLRLSNAGGGVYNLEIRQIVSGSSSTIGTSQTFSCSVGTLIWVNANGSTINVYCSNDSGATWSLVNTATTSLTSSGSIGLGGTNVTGVTGTFDDLSIASTVASVGSEFAGTLPALTASAEFGIAVAGVGSTFAGTFSQLTSNAEFGATVPISIGSEFAGKFNPLTSTAEFGIVVPSGFPSTGLLDDFNRADLGNIGTNWVKLTPGGDPYPRIINNQCWPQVGSGAASGGAWLNAFGQDQEFFCDIASVDTGQTLEELFIYAGLNNLNSGNINGYRLKINAVGSAWTLQRVNPFGVYTTLGTYTQALTAGDGIGIRRKGSTGETEAYYRAGAGGSFVKVITGTNDTTYTGSGFAGFDINRLWAIDRAGGGTIGVVNVGSDFGGLFSPLTSSAEFSIVTLGVGSDFAGTFSPLTSTAEFGIVVPTIAAEFSGAFTPLAGGAEFGIVVPGVVSEFGVMFAGLTSSAEFGVVASGIGSDFAGAFAPLIGGAEFGVITPTIAAEFGALFSQMVGTAEFGIVVAGVGSEVVAEFAPLASNAEFGVSAPLVVGEFSVTFSSLVSSFEVGVTAPTIGAEFVGRFSPLASSAEFAVLVAGISNEFAGMFAPLTSSADFGVSADTSAPILFVAMRPSVLLVAKRVRS